MCCSLTRGVNSRLCGILRMAFLGCRDEGGEDHSLWTVVGFYRPYGSPPSIWQNLIDCTIVLLISILAKM